MCWLLDDDVVFVIAIDHVAAAAAVRDLFLSELLSTNSLTEPETLNPTP